MAYAQQKGLEREDMADDRRIICGWDTGVVTVPLQVIGLLFGLCLIVMFCLVNMRLPRWLKWLIPEDL